MLEVYFFFSTKYCFRMSLSYADSLHLESIESRKVPSKENREEEKEENFDLISGEMTFQGLNEHIFQR